MIAFHRALMADLSSTYRFFLPAVKDWWQVAPPPAKKSTKKG